MELYITARFGRPITGQSCKQALFCFLCALCWFMRLIVGLVQKKTTKTKTKHHDDIWREKGLVHDVFLFCTPIFSCLRGKGVTIYDTIRYCCGSD